MRTYFDCIPCFFKQAIEAARICGSDPDRHRKVIDAVARVIPEISMDTSPPEMGRVIHDIVKKSYGVDDPYRDIKIKSNRLAVGVKDRFKKKIESSSNKLLDSVELAIAGNIIDYGVKNTLNVEAELENILKGEHKAIQNVSRELFNFDKFNMVLEKAQNILYLADNAGETVFDLLLIEQIKKMYKDKNIIYAVKEKPIINDALVEDARLCGIDKKAEVISSGADAPGTVLSICSKYFLKTFEHADMVISKGQGNFEALSSSSKRPVFFLFMAKCGVVAQHVGCNIGSILLLYYPGK